ncbi:Rieske (2Fe-2S) protein [Tessaracoccus sp. G1721]
MTTRRELIAAGAAIAAALLAGCADDAAPQSSGAAPADEVTVPKDSVPVGGGLVLDGGFVVTQPEAGAFFAFSSRCTHQGNTVSEVREDGIFCRFHGSLFALRDGTPVQGPATDPLVRATLTESGTDLIVAA